MSDVSCNKSENNVETPSRFCNFKETCTAIAESIDQQAPSLVFLGMGCWIAWNTIAFSGSFWLYDTTNNFRSENLMTVHLAACVVTLLVCSMLSGKTKVLTRNSIVLTSGFVALLGTALIVITRETIMPSGILFNLGCLLTGMGTSVSILRGAEIFGALPPHRAMYQLAACNLFALAVYFILNSCSNDVAVVCFILLPLFMSLFFCLRKNRLQRTFHSTKAQSFRPTRQFILFLLTIGLCSTAIEFVHSYNLILLPPSYSVESTALAQLIVIPIMLCVMAAILISKSVQKGFSKIYSATIGLLVILLISISLFSLRSIYVATANSAICTCFNMTAWAIMFYIAFQSKGNPVEIFGLGNAMLSSGTLVAGITTTIIFNFGIEDNILKVVITILGIILLCDVLFVFSEKQLDHLLSPIDKTTMSHTGDVSSKGKRRGEWVEDCKKIADRYSLSKRETEVFILLARGRSAEEIASYYTLSVYTIRAHTRSIYAKLDIHSHKELIEFIESHRNDPPPKTK